MSKRFLCAILCGLLIAAVLVVPATAESQMSGTVTADALRLRAEPSTNASVLATATRGDGVTILNTEPLSNGYGAWYKVLYKNTTGFMSADYIKINDENPDTSADASELTGYGVVTGSRVNVRSEPNTNCAVLSILSKGTIVEVTGLSDGWYGIRHNGITGYMSAEYVTYSSEKPVPLAAPASQTSYSSDVASMAAYGSGYGEKSTTTAVDRLVAAAALDGANPTEKQREIVEKAFTYLGSPYVYGASNGKTFDCGGFTSYVYRECGLPINRTAVDQYKSTGTKVAGKDDLQPGDLVLFRDPNVSSNIVTHVGMYVGQGKFIHAGSGSAGSGKCVKINDLSAGYYSRVYYAAKRVVN